ncbi:MAG: purine-nucleoside phosphorylase [Alphaproteobacteria bacterium]|nr:purine-nucleoside phosphorylase [Alphaproteobacteria bacterium]MBO4644288.1 purine-nucleoside phosphorylase [Alphaproteobacteria bacterium]
MKETINQVAQQIKEKIGNCSPKIGIILGSGLGGVAEAIKDAVVIPYEDIKGFPRSTVSGHAGQLVIGKLNGVDVLCMQGRVHFYEGHPPAALALVIRAYKKLGIEKLILTNASGSLNIDMGPGSLMVISDHINLSGCNPLIGPNDDTVGPRFPDMTYAYDPDLRKTLLQTAEKEGINMRSGVYLMTSGPNFETPAEIRMFRILGADAVGMSTVSETLCAVHCGMKVVGVSVITNYGSGMVSDKQTHEETIAQANEAGKKLQRILTRFVTEI